MQQRIRIIAGPTASGKSALAVQTARAENGVVINADAMQLYSDLRVVTARPSPEEEAHAPHALYGVLPAAQPASTGIWLGLVRDAIETAWGQGRLPVVTGGTGLYLKSLRHGISPMPDVPDEVRAKTRSRMDIYGSAVLHAELDPVMAARLDPGDTQRITRALEIVEATGTSLAEWQAMPPVPLFPDAVFEVTVMDVPRDELYRRCDARFLAMMEQGALEEVDALLAQNLSFELPAMRAVGVPELAAYICGKITREEAIQKAQQATRNYAKRQLTWLRNQTL